MPRIGRPSETEKDAYRDLYMDGYTPAEISRITGRQQKTVRKNL